MLLQHCTDRTGKLQNCWATECKTSRSTSGCSCWKVSPLSETMRSASRVGRSGLSFCWKPTTSWRQVYKVDKSIRGLRSRQQSNAPRWFCATNMLVHIDNEFYMRRMGKEGVDCWENVIDIIYCAYFATKLSFFLFKKYRLSSVEVNYGFIIEC